MLIQNGKPDLQIVALIKKMPHPIMNIKYKANTLYIKTSDV